MAIRKKYHEWIVANVTESYGKCSDVTEAMLAEFPELRRVRGHYYCFSWGERAHWWLVEPDGRIVDPTRDQFPSKGKGEYVEWDESRDEPTGRCLDCGELVFNGETFCGEICRQATVEFMSFK